MTQYLELLQAILEKGTYKPPAREGMPGSISLFGYQNRYDLQKGFPLITTKKMYWKGIVTELLWFLRGDTNVSYLNDHGVEIWNEDAYNYYKKQCFLDDTLNEDVMSFEEFIAEVKTGEWNNHPWFDNGYVLGDCGFQYGKVWRAWELDEKESYHDGDRYPSGEYKWKFRHKSIDQIKKVLYSLKNNPEGRRHIVTAVDPAHDEDLALYWCHSMFQFNCRPATRENTLSGYWDRIDSGEVKFILDCQLYQRSADVVLGVPFNIASYALLTHIVAHLVGMVPGEFIHTFGDVHIYDNHMEAVKTQLQREPRVLPQLVMSEWVDELSLETFDSSIYVLHPDDFKLSGYDPHPKIEAKLSTGLK